MFSSRRALKLLLRIRGTACDGSVFAPAFGSSKVPSTNKSLTSSGQTRLSTQARVLYAQGVRGFASSANAAEDGKFGRDLQVRFVRVVAFGMILVAANKVVPLMFQSTVPHAVGLCEAKEPIMQKAAAHRVSRLAENDGSLKELVDAGVAHKLLAMIKPDVEPGVSSAVLSAIKEISRLPEGRDALKSAGATSKLDEALQQNWLPTEEHGSLDAVKIKRWLTVR